MKHVRMTAGIAGICAALAMAVSAAAVSAGERDAQQVQAAGSELPQTAVSAAYAEQKETYILRLSGNSVAIYLQGHEDNPLLVTEISAGSLRESDRELLENGITVSSYDEILRLLEDFNS